MPTDTLYPEKFAGDKAPGSPYAAAMRVRAGGALKEFLWIGLHGQLAVTLNGAKVLEEQNAEACHVGKFKVPIELKSGENQLVFHLRGL